MKQNKNTSYSCVMCGKPTTTLHEIFYGTADRKMSIKYNLQVPLCHICHGIAHTEKQKYQEIFCEKHGIKWDCTLWIVNKVLIWNLMVLSKLCAKNLGSWKV